MIIKLSTYETALDVYILDKTLSKKCFLMLLLNAFNFFSTILCYTCICPLRRKSFVHIAIPQVVLGARLCAADDAGGKEASIY